MFLLKVKIKQNPACWNMEYNVKFKHFHQNIKAYPRSQENLHWPMIRKMLHIEKNVKNVAYLGGVAKPGKSSNFSLLLSLEIVFPTFKLTRNCYSNMNISFLWKLAIWSWNGSPSLFYKYTVPEIGTSKAPISKVFSELGKIWKCNVGLYSKNIAFNLFPELWKNEKSSWSNIQKSQNLLVNWEESGSTA